MLLSGLLPVIAAALRYDYLGVYGQRGALHQLRTDQGGGDHCKGVTTS